MTRVYDTQSCLLASTHICIAHMNTYIHRRIFEKRHRCVDWKAAMVSLFGLIKYVCVHAELDGGIIANHFSTLFTAARAPNLAWSCDTD